MPSHIPEILLWLFVINLGIAYGAGLYEKKIVVPDWFAANGVAGLRVDRAAMRHSNTGLRFWAFVTTGPLTLLTLANLVVAWQSAGPRHDWWMAAAGITLVERTGTFAFFIPTAIKLMRDDDLPESKLSAMGSRWMRLNYLRDALALIGWLAALKTLSLPA